MSLIFIVLLNSPEMQNPKNNPEIFENTMKEISDELNSFEETYIKEKNL